MAFWRRYAAQPVGLPAAADGDRFLSPSSCTCDIQTVSAQEAEHTRDRLRGIADPSTDRDERLGTGQDGYCRRTQQGEQRISPSPQAMRAGHPNKGSVAGQRRPE
ncbi:hypothetical protein [Streptomyces cyslabdanicus]|uniref:hypothetical protein n=1 Tax=Streptomyces cyslabdanicus TaxID=1470456 RepID=UPI004043C487